MHQRTKRILPAALCVLLLSTALAWRGGEEQVLDPLMHHLGNDPTPEWPEAPVDPEGSSLSFEFEARANAEEWTLLFSQRNINNRWRVAINGHEIAICRPADALIESFYAVPAGTLVDGANLFELTTDQPADDITFGRISLLHEPFREALDLRLVRVRVSDGWTGEAIPARLTITDPDHGLVPVFFAQDLHQATREGVVYTDRGVASFELPVGEYRIFASRGSEWGLDSASVELAQSTSVGVATELSLSLQREVDTTGFVAADTHIHTLTFSGHGDSSVEERMVTLAGEGVELAISTDHNHNTDYAPYQRRMGLGQYFTSVVGNEVTTPIGHFNAFPLDPEQEVPPYELHDDVQLLEGMRSRGAQVVILNHPRWPSHAEGPWGVVELNHFTGRGNGKLYNQYTFDGMELANSCTEEKEPLLLFRDWFSLLNRGERVFAVGSSDSHTVGNPVGGGRTYVPSATDDPAAIDVDAACAAFRSGRTSVAMGIYLETSVATRPGQASAGMGDLAQPDGGACETRLRIQAPSWVRPRLATLYANGTALASIDLDTSPGRPTDIHLEHELRDDFAGQDAWVVWVVTGDGIEGPHWPLSNNYTLGATNPVFLDWSGDGQYQSPRQTGLALVEENGWDTPAIIDAIEGSWEAVAFHALDEARARFLFDARARLESLGLESGVNETRVREFLGSLKDWDAVRR